MHYTSWDRTDRTHPRLLADAGPEVLATFNDSVGTAEVGEATWGISKSADALEATLDDGRTFALTGDLSRGKTLDADLAGRRYTVVAETSREFIIDDADSNKVAQFTSKNSGVRRALLEFEHDDFLPIDDVVALSWFTRQILEARLEPRNNALLITLVALSVIALLVIFL